MSRHRLAENGLQRYLQHLFPKRGVNVQIDDYGHQVTACFVVEDDVGATRLHGIRAAAGHVETPQGRRDFAGKLLRTAYPRGWAVP